MSSDRRAQPNGEEDLHLPVEYGYCRIHDEFTLRYNGYLQKSGEFHFLWIAESLASDEEALSTGKVIPRRP